MTDADAQTVAEDPQYGTEALLRPQSNFQAIYQNQNIANPLYWYPNGEALDPRAGQPGVSPRLVRGLRVTPGSTLQLWLPNLVYLDLAADPPQARGYRWSIIWRLRNLFDFNQARIPWHLVRSRGAADTRFGDQARTLLPAAYHGLWYNFPPVPGPQFVNAGRCLSQLRAEDFLANANALQGPLLDPSGTTGDIQQGVFDPAAIGGGELPFFLCAEVKVPMADEMLLACYRPEEPGVPDAWGFEATEPDNTFATFLGATPDLGVFVFLGTDSGMRSAARSDLGGT